MNHLISIIIVNYYSENEIKACLSSIEKKNSADIECVIVSNSPRDKRLELFTRSLNFSTEIYYNNNNLGFAKACNVGADLAKGDFLFFLNPDTSFLNDTAQELLDCYYSINQAGLLGAKTFNQDHKLEPSIKNSLSKGYFLTWVFPFLGSLFPSKKIGHYFPESTSEVLVVNGHSMFIQKQLFQKIGGMEEEFFMYWEENDLCLRIKKSGYKVIYCSEAKIMHISGTSTSPFFSKMEVEKHRSQKKFILKHYPSWNLLNRTSGVAAYFWRVFACLFSFKKSKIKQFWNLFIWYAFKYK